MKYGGILYTNIKIIVLLIILSWMNGTFTSNLLSAIFGEEKNFTLQTDFKM